jgi:hypothetical protein
MSFGVREARMNKNLIALSIILGVAGSIGAKTYFKPSPATIDVTSQTALSKLASDMNKTLPMMIDKDTELVATIGLQGTFVYNYRLVNHVAQDLDPQKINELMKPNIINSACTTPETRDQFLHKGVTLRYSYADKDRRHVTSIDVTPQDCKA